MQLLVFDLGSKIVLLCVGPFTLSLTTAAVAVFS